MKEFHSQNVIFSNKNISIFWYFFFIIIIIINWFDRSRNYSIDNFIFFFIMNFIQCLTVCVCGHKLIAEYIFFFYMKKIQEYYLLHTKYSFTFKCGYFFDRIRGSLTSILYLHAFFRMCVCELNYHLSPLNGDILVIELWIKCMQTATGKIH